MTSIVTQNRRAAAIQSPSATIPLVGNDTREIVRRVEALHNRPSPGSLRPSVNIMSSIEEHLFDALANAKILTSQVAMHFSDDWRSKLFRQLDSLHDPEEWEPGDLPVRQDSFGTFLRAILSIKPERRPGLGLSHVGNLVATWTTGRDRLTIEFLTEDRVRWVLSRYGDDNQPERFAGEVDVTRLSESLLSYHPEHWLMNVQSHPAA